MFLTDLLLISVGKNLTETVPKIFCLRERVYAFEKLNWKYIFFVFLVAADSLSHSSECIIRTLESFSFVFTSQGHFSFGRGLVAVLFALHWKVGSWQGVESGVSNVGDLLKLSAWHPTKHIDHLLQTIKGILCRNWHFMRFGSPCSLWTGHHCLNTNRRSVTIRQT